ncbi:MAG TPA: cation transporter [Pyrinomonadaceae bacterium]|jgi:divalent metal cation (Fe/Co/Zn/Cd) transporter
MLAVLGALVANGLITILKFIGALLTGSAGLMAESLHSLADTTNQVFVIAAVGLLLGQYPVPPYEGRLWDGIASITIGVVLAIVAFYLARSSRGLLLGEAATAKNCAKILEAVKSHLNVVDVVELLTMHLAPKQILVNAHVNLKDDLTNNEIIQTIAEIEETIKKAEPKVDMIFLETARQKDSNVPLPMPQHIG